MQSRRDIGHTPTLGGPVTAEYASGSVSLTGPCAQKARDPGDPGPRRNTPSCARVLQLLAEHDAQNAANRLSRTPQELISHRERGDKAWTLDHFPHAPDRHRQRTRHRRR